MSWLNLNYGLLVHDDESVTNPQIKLVDIVKDIQNIPVNHDQSDRVTLYTNESKTLATTSRPLAWDATTQIKFDRYIVEEDNVRLTYTGTGTNPAFRTDRLIGGAADTEISITRVTPYVARIQNVAGTVWSLGNVAVNDYIRFEKDTDSFTSPLHATNKGKTYQVTAKGADYIDFVDNGNSALDANIALGADYEQVIRVMSQGPVKVGDTIEIRGSGINPSNHGKYTVTDISTDYVEFVNALGVEQTVLIGTNSLVVYEHLIGFIHIRSTGPFKIRFDSQSEWASVDRLGNEAIFMGSMSAHAVEAQNDGPEPIVVSIQHVMVL